VEFNKKIEFEMLERKEERRLYERNREKLHEESRKKGEHDCYLEEIDVDADLHSTESFILLNDEEL
jgi:hypothetical protein